MSESPNKLIKFWQELKRRKVFKVVAMYSGTAFIILEVVNNLVGPLRLPDWTPTLVIVLVGIGFPFAIIFSWIFDITPQGLKKTESIEAIRKKKGQAVPVKRGIKASDIIIALMAIVIAILLFPKIVNRDKFRDIKDPDGRISIAVMPFQNLTNDTIWDIWQDGIQVNLISSLSNNPEELKVRQTESINTLLQSRGLKNYASLTPSVAGTISQKLDANVFINGSINKSGATIRVNAQLTNARNGDIFKSFQTDGTADKILPVIDSLSKKIRDFLVISKLIKESSHEAEAVVSTRSPEAYRYLVNGVKSFYKLDYPSAREMFFRALDIDSNLVIALLYLSVSYGNQEIYDAAKKWSLRAYERREQMPMIQELYTNWVYASYFETPYEEIKYLREMVDIDDQLPMAFYILGYNYLLLNQYDKAIQALEKVLEIRRKWGLKPSWIYNYTTLGESYHKTGKYNKEAKLYKKAEQDFPDDPVLLYQQAVLSLSQGKTEDANIYIEKYKSIRRENSWSEALITAKIAGIYFVGDFPDKAEEYYQTALSLEPRNPERMYNLARFLIDKDRDVNKGLELADKALEMDPGNYSYLDTKGWGLYKQGKYREALEILEKSWELKPIYDHDLFLHLEAARKAIATQNNN
jgi:tetratricopeptide (TPR) repeat protein